MTYYFRRVEVGLLGDLCSYNINTIRGLLHNLGGPPLGEGSTEIDADRGLGTVQAGP
jgi:hypothetical protein